MMATRVKSVLVFLLMAGAFVASEAWRPTARLADTRPKVELETIFPKVFADWVTDDRMPVQLIAPDTQAMLDKIYNATLTRTYINSKGDRIMLSVAYGGDQSDGTRAHRPEVCYPAQGFQILDSSENTLHLASQDLRVKQLVSRLGSRIEPITYWITVGDRVVITGTEQKLAQLSYSSLGVIPDGMLVRISSIDPDTGHARLVQAKFLEELVTAVPAQDRSRLFGAAFKYSDTGGSRSERK